MNKTDGIERLSEGPELEEAAPGREARACEFFVTAGPDGTVSLTVSFGFNEPPEVK